MLVAITAGVGMGLRPPRVLALLNRTMHASSQLPVRVSLLLAAGLYVLAQELGFESIFGGFMAGMIVGLVLAFLAWRFVAGLAKLAILAVIVVAVLYVLSNGGIA